MNKPTLNACCALATSNLIAWDTTQSQRGQSRRPGLPCSWIRRWLGFLSSALLLLLICGPASAQFVKVVNWANTPRPAQANPVNTLTGIDLDDSTTVFVVGMYTDGNGGSGNLYSAVTFGGVPPTGLMNNGASTRTAMAYWINPNTAAGQTLSYEYANNGSFQGFAWRYELSNVDTNASIVTSASPIAPGLTASLTTLTNNSFVISFIGANNDSAFTVNPPLTQAATTLAGGGAGRSMASATNTIATPGLQNISWNVTGGSVNQQSVGAIAFIPADLGAPIVAASVSPSLTASGGVYTVTATIDPFRFGNVTNVSVDLSSIGGPAANALVQSSDPNVWTNSFIVPGGAPLGTANLIVTVKQDAAPITGSGSAEITIAAPSAPVIVQDTIPTTSLNMYVGQGVTFSATFSAPGSITYAWQKSPDGITFTNIPGAENARYTISSVTLSDAGYYRLQASNFLGSAESTPTQITVNDPTPAVYIWSAPIPFAGLTAEQILTNFPATNKIAGAMRAQNGGNPTTVILTNAGNRPVVFAVPGNWASLSEGVGYLPNVSTNKTANASFDSCLSIGYNNNGPLHNITLGGLVVGQKYQVQLFGLDNRPGLTPVGSLQFSSFQDPTDINGITSEQFAMADNVYVLGTFTASNNVMTIQQNLVASAGNFNCLVLRTVGWEPPPYFTVQPKNTNNFIGTTRVTLTGSAAADTTIVNPTITYQWASGPVGGPYTNLVAGIKYAGVTTTTLSVSNLVASDADPVYVLKATNGGGTATSRETRIYVQSLPVVPPANTNSFAGAVLTMTNIPNSRLAGLWQLNETNDPSTGLLIAYDASGNGRSGTYGATAQNGFNGVLAPQPPPFNGFATNQGALQTGTAGTGDLTSAVNLPPLNITNGVATTIAMWIYPTATAAQYGWLLGNQTLGDVCGFGFGANTGGPSNQRALGFTWSATPAYATFAVNTALFPVDNQWNFVVFVVRTNAVTFYLNYVDGNGAAFFGKYVEAPANTTYNQQKWNGSPIAIGADPGNNVFPGRISSVAVFNSALTDDQITSLFAAGYQVSGFAAGFVQQPPENITNYVGFTLQITAQPGGTLPITNQWKFNGNNLVDGWFNGSVITGSKSNVLTIQNVSTNWQGVYTLAVTNALGGAVSSNANVTILEPVAPPAGNLVGKWFDGTSSLADHSGNLPGTHNAYGVGASATNYVFTNNVPPGKSGTSLSLFGGTSMGISNSWLTDPGYVNTFDEGIATSFTVTAWAKGQPGVWNPFVSKNGEAEGWQLRRGSGANAVFTLRGTVTADPLGAAGGSGADGAWHHYVGTFDSATTTRTLYVDGVVQNVTTGDASYTLSPNSRLVLGGRFNPPGVTNAIDGAANFTGGQLYDVRIYNTALTEAQQAYLAAPGPLALPAQTLSVTPGNPGQIVLSWLNGGLLLQATNVLGPWVTNQAATPPYTVLTTNAAGFFRVQFP